MAGEHDDKAAAKIPERDAWGCCKSILAETLRWSDDVPANRPQILAATLGMTGPVLLGVTCGNPGAGMLAAYGAMVVGGVEPGGKTRKKAIELTGVMLVGTAAVCAGSLIGGHGWQTGGAIIVIAFLSSLLGGLGRTAAQAAIRFMILTIVGVGIGEGGPQPPLALLAIIFAAGSLWGIAVSLFVSLLGPPPACRPELPPKVVLSSKERIKRWRRSLAHFSGWQYPLRVTSCMLAAGVITFFLQQQRSYWVFLTIAIVLQRSFAAAFSRILQRGAGTAAGVLLGSLLLLWPLPDWSLVLFIGTLAALRAFFKARNYALYAMVMTPLIILVISLGRPVTGSLLLERLVDTAMGCIIAYGLGCSVWPNQNDRTM